MKEVFSQHLKLAYTFKQQKLDAALEVYKKYSCIIIIEYVKA